MTKTRLLIGQAALFTMMWIGFAIADSRVVSAAVTDLGGLAGFTLLGFGIGVVTEVFARLRRGPIALLELDASSVWAPTAAALVIAIREHALIDRIQALVVAATVALGYLAALAAVGAARSAKSAH